MGRVEWSPPDDSPKRSDSSPSHQFPMKNTITNPVFNHTYMGQRYYNSKKIVWEPFIFQRVNERAMDKFVGVWVQDNRSGESSQMKPLDLKWIERKLHELNDESAFISSKIVNLRHLQAVKY